MTPPLILISPSTQKRGVEFEDNSANLSNQYSMAVATAGIVPPTIGAGPSMGMEAPTGIASLLCTDMDITDGPITGTDIPIITIAGRTAARSPRASSAVWPSGLSRHRPHARPMPIPPARAIGTASLNAAVR